MPQVHEQIITEKMAADLLGVEPRQVRLAIQQGRLPSAARVAGWAILLSDVQALKRSGWQPRRPGRPAKVEADAEAIVAAAAEALKPRAARPGRSINAAPPSVGRRPSRQQAGRSITEAPRPLGGGQRPPGPPSGSRKA